MPVHPHYAEPFHCIGSDCEDNCCRGWGMVVDQPSYQKYKQIAGLGPLLEQYFVPITKDCSPSRYVMIQTNADANCPLLGEDRLCTLHKNYGPAYLCHTCATYPRVQQPVDGITDNALLLSCPEAARQVLLSQDLLPGLPRTYSRFFTVSEPSTLDAEPQPFLWDFREFTLILLRDRSYPLWARLFLLGSFTRQIEKLLCNHEAGLIPWLLRGFAHIVVQGSLCSSIDGIPARPAIQLKMLVDVICQSLIHTNPALCSLQECLSTFSEGLQLTSAADLDTAAANYATACTKYFEPFLRRHPQVLENYLINQIFCAGFPFRSTELQKNFLWICVEFALIKGLLIGMSAYHRESFAREHVVKLVQSLSKAVEHQPAFRAAINWEGLADPEVLSALLKNDVASEPLANLAGDHLAQRGTVLEPVA